MNIIFFVNQFPAYSETFILNQITGLIDKGHDVNIIAVRRANNGILHAAVNKYGLMDRTVFLEIPRDVIRRFFRTVYTIVTSFFRFPGITLRSLNYKKFRSFKHIFSIIPVAEQSPDIILCNYGYNGLTALALKKSGIDARVAVIFHGNDVSGYIEKYGSSRYEKIFSDADLLITVSELWRRRLIELGCDSDKIKLLHMGVDTLKFEYKEHGYNGQINFLSIGRLVAKKGFNNAVRSFAEIKKYYGDKYTVKYTIIGSGPEKDKLDSLIRDMALSQDISIAGPLSQESVISHINEAHIFLAPSMTSSEGDMEGIPVSIMEAMSAGLTVVSTVHSGIPELIDDDVSGLLAKENDIDDFTDKIKKVLDHPEFSLKFGRAARDKIEKEFNISVLNDILEQYLKMIG